MKFSQLFFYTLCLSLFIITPACLRRENKDDAVVRYYEQSVIEAERGNFERSFTYINKALSITPTARLKAYKATLLAELQRFPESIALFEEVINNTKTPAHIRADAMNNYAGTLVRTGKPEKAAVIWRQLCRERDYLTPEVAHLNLGLLSLSQGFAKEGDEKELTYRNARYSEAIKEFNEALKISRDYVDALYYRAIAQGKLGKIEEARESATKVISLEPTHEPALRILNELHEPKKESMPEHENEHTAQYQQ
jgi:tetratricopeptide (TPR) repeat protein